MKTKYKSTQDKRYGGLGIVKIMKLARADRERKIGDIRSNERFSIHGIYVYTV